MREATVRLWLLLLACALSWSTAAGDAAGGLDALVARAPALAAYDARLEAASLRVEAARRRAGPSLYGSMTYREGEEVVDSDRKRDLEQLSSEIGVRVPVLGSRLQVRAGEDEQRIALERMTAERELLRRDLMRRAGESWADYWGARRIETLAREFLRDRDELERTLGLRTLGGLLLDSDRLEFLSGLELARRDEFEARARRVRAAGELEVLLGEPVDISTLGRPPLAPACEASGDPAALLTKDPELDYLEQVIALRESTPRDSALYPVNSDVRLAWRKTREASIEPADSAMVMWTFDVPVGYFRERRIQSSTAAAELAHARLERELRRAEIEEDARFRLAQREVLAQSRQFASMRLAASDEAVRERSLRATVLPGDTLEQLQQARLARYQAARDLVNAEVELARWVAGWSRFVSNDCVAPSAVPPADSGRAVYLWQSAPLIDASARAEGAAVLEGLHARGIDALLIGLDRVQAARFGADPAPLAEFARAVRAAGMRAELLLGEPTWILPESRHELTDLVMALADVPFDGLHLDLEPNQLDESAWDSAWLLEQLVITLAQARAVSPWPVDFSVHPRYLDRPTADGTVGSRLERLDVGVTLMIYVANPERAIEIASPILATHPGLRFRIALSLEKTLPAEETLAGYDEQERERRIARVETGLAAGNFDGITLQPARGWPQDIRLAGGD